MKKYLFMMTALLVAFTSFALVACGGDDDNDPAKPETNTYKFSIQLTEKEAGQIDDFLAIYPDLSLTYKLPGKPAVTVPVGKAAISAESETTETGRIELKFTGTLAESKLDEAKKYSFVPVLKYEIHQEGYTQRSLPEEVLGFSGITGANLKERHSKFEFPYNVSLHKPNE